MMFKNVFKKIINKIIDKSLIRGDCSSLQFFFFYHSPIISKNLSLFQSLSYGRYFPLYSPLKPSSPYTCSSSKPPLEYLSHQSFFLVMISQETLFRNLLHINVAIKVGTMNLMWWQQLFSRYFGDFLLPRVFVSRLYVVETLQRIIITVQVNN